MKIFTKISTMRRTFNPQFKLGGVPVSKIKIDLTSRDDIPPLLLGLQHIFCTPRLREKVFSILEEMLRKRDKAVNNGRPGMDLWKILVLGVLRLNLNCDYDRLRELANNHRTIRQMLGHGLADDNYDYKLQTLKDNISLLTPEILNKINHVVVMEGHNLVRKKDNEPLRGRCDSFVLETNVCFPTDIHMLYEATRKVITLVAAACAAYGVTDWRQSQHNIKKLKRLYRKIQKLKHSTSKDKKKKEAQAQLIKSAHQEYMDIAGQFIEKACDTLRKIEGGGINALASKASIESFIAHAERLMDQISRRVIKGEKIPHEEKIFSIFEEHTEWISKGKAGVPVELGLKVCIFEDQHGFILNHMVMQKQTDDQVAVPIVKETKELFPHLSSASFDKGFYSPANLKDLADYVDFVVMPKKGKLSEEDKEREYSEEFIKQRHQHSAVESAINALEVHGLDQCPDSGIDGFKRYVSLAVLARNIQQLGVKIKQQRLKKEQRKLTSQKVA